MTDLQTMVLSQLRNERERQRLTQMDAALRMGISLSVLNKIERGARGNIKLNTLERYANALGHQLEIRLALSDESQPINPSLPAPGAISLEAPQAPDLR